MSGAAPTRRVRHLIDMGHTAIGLFDGAHRHGNAEKRDGYLQALDEAGLGHDPELWVDPQGHTAERGYWATGALMEGPRRPTAIFASSDSLALGALRWALKHKLRVPEDLAIVGMDNIQYAEYAAVPLTTVNYAAETVTQMAIDRLMRLIAAGDQLPEPRVTQIDPDLVVRESTWKQV